MRATMVRYRVRAECAAENEMLVRGVYEQLQRERPDGIHYATFVAEDGVTFMHVFLSESEERAAALPRLEAFRRFRTELRERCEEPPASTQLREVGSFRFPVTGVPEAAA